jgi:hypothetical protein
MTTLAAFEVIFNQQEMSLRTLAAVGQIKKISKQFHRSKKEI